MAAPDNLPPAEPKPEPALLALARKKFGTLSPAEEELFRAAQQGRGAYGNETEDNPADANWLAEWVVRAECIRWVCTDPHASAFVTYRGLQLGGMRIDGELDLSNAEIKFSLLVGWCAFLENISLRDAQLKCLYLLGCQIKSLNAGRATVDGSVIMCDGFKAEGGVDLIGATIGGDLDCSGAHFLNAGGLVLTANGAKIEGRVLLCDGFKAEGEVTLASATIGGDLDCSGAQFSNAQRLALIANGAKIEGSVFLRNGFEADGRVNLVNAKIGGNLECDGAKFSNSEGLAFGASAAQIKGSVFFRDGFEAKGAVDLAGATIGGSVDCVGGAQFSNAEGLALSAGGAKIEGSVFLHNGFEAEGRVNLVGIRIGGSLECDGAKFSNSEGLALTANGAKIEGSVFLRNGFEADGEVHLSSAKIGGNLECSGAQLSNAKGSALNAGDAQIEGNVYLHGGFKAKGKVNLAGATIGNLQIRDILEAQYTILDLRLAKVGTFWDNEKSWPKADNLFLDGFRYERLYEDAPFQANKRKEWLNLQPRDKFWPQPYEHLAAVLRQMGHEPEARQIMIEKNRARARLTSPFRQGWWWYNVFGKLIGYGYRPWRAFAMSVAMILLGTVLFYLGSTHDLISPTGEKAYAKEPNGQVILETNERPKISEDYPVFNALVYSLESFTPLLKLDQSANWTPNANQHAEVAPFGFKVPFSGSFLRYYLYFHIASGWLLTSLWVGAITGLVKT